MLAKGLRQCKTFFCPLSLHPRSRHILNDCRARTQHIAMFRAKQLGENKATTVHSIVGVVHTTLVEGESVEPNHIYPTA